MFILVTGGSGSGKSAYAEQTVLSFGEARRYYIATMQCFDEESKKRVQRHRRMRSGKGFDTIEQPLHLKRLTLPDAPDCRKVSVLLECLSNLAANEMFDPEGSGREAFWAICDGIDTLMKQCDNLVVVTNEIFSDGVRYSPETTEYQRLLGRLNTALAKKADRVVEVTASIPLIVKQ